MCLYKVTKVYKEPKRMLFYKVMKRERRKGKLNLYRFPYRYGIPGITKGKIYRAVSGRAFTRGYRMREYQVGFHAFASLKMAARRVQTDPDLRKRSGNRKVVLLCEGLVHTVGTQWDSRIVVASEMKILREIPLAQLREAQGIKPKKKKKVS